jgi:hypothetical protein
MELVRGVTLLEYARRREAPLDTAELRRRLRMFLGIAEAVH